MSPVEQAAAVYDSEPSVRTFREDLELHLLNGFVFSTPEFFIMGRAIERSAAHALIVNPAHRFQAELCDCWHIYLMSGSMVKAWSIIPWQLPWFSFERKNELRFHHASVIRRLSGG